MVIRVTACRQYLIAMAFMHTFLEAVHAQHTGGVYRAVPAVSRIQYGSLILKTSHHYFFFLSNRSDVEQSGLKNCKS